MLGRKTSSLLSTSDALCVHLNIANDTRCSRFGLIRDDLFSIQGKKKGAPKLWPEPASFPRKHDIGRFFESKMKRNTRASLATATGNSQRRIFFSPRIVTRKKRGQKMMTDDNPSRAEDRNIDFQLYPSIENEIGSAGPFFPSRDSLDYSTLRVSANNWGGQGKAASGFKRAWRSLGGKKRASNGLKGNNRGTERKAGK